MLTNKVAVITGGTRGIGFAIAKKFLKNNAKVIIFGSQKSTVESAIKLLKEINTKYIVEGYWPNLSILDEVKSLMKIIYDKYGKIDILINNAGVTDMTPIYAYTDELYDKIMNINVKAVFHCIFAVLPYMREAKQGCIINTSSMVSLNGQGIGFAYPVSKYAVNGLTISLSKELGPDKIRVNAVAPGVVNTDMVQNLPEQYKKPLVRAIPLGKIAEPEEIASDFLFLASDDAKYISGDILYSTCGYRG